MLTVASQLPFRSVVLHANPTHRLVPTVHIAEAVNYIVYVRVSCSHCAYLCTVRNVEYICYKKCRKRRRKFSDVSVPDRAVYKYVILFRTVRSIFRSFMQKIRVNSRKIARYFCYVGDTAYCSYARKDDLKGSIQHLVFLDSPAKF
jgi:hypothetical protein